MAVVAGIAATVPFKPARGDMMGETPDGHMGELAQRVEAVLRNDGQGAWFQTNDIMALSVHLANRDIAPFIMPGNFAAVISNGRKVKKEEVPELRAQITNLRQLVRAAGLERSAPLLYQWIGSGGGPVPADNVPHFYTPRSQEGVPQPAEAYPPLTVYEKAVLHAEHNSRLAALFFQAHEVGIVLAASIAGMNDEPDAEVPGFVHATSWRDTAQALPQRGLLLSEGEQAVYTALLYGEGQETIDTATPVRSPIGGVILGALGANGIRELSAEIARIRTEQLATGNRDAFSGREAAETLVDSVVDRIGMRNFELIINELKHVAQEFARNPNRVAYLDEVLSHYATR